MPELMLGDIREMWSRIRPALEEIKRDQMPDWIPEDIYHWVLSDQATLYATDDGFTVVQRRQNQITRQIYLLVIVSYAWQPSSNISKYLPEFEELAGRIGAKYIEVRSKRRGYERVGFDVQQIVYRRAV